MKLGKKIFVSSLLTLSVLFVAGGVVNSKNNPNHIVLGYTNNDGATYYNGITNSEGKTLLTQLQTLNSQRLKSRVGYNSMPSKFSQTDPGGNGKVMAFYSGTVKSYSGNMNREHVWPASRTVLGRNKDPLEDDIHMVRPTLSAENGSRGNSFYVEGKKHSALGWDPAAESFGDETYRGDAARIIFYCVVADSQLYLVDTESASSSDHTMGKLSDLLKWNLKYPVLEREKVRNEAAEKLQGNRNPFIDHPEYACKIWGKYNSITKDICKNVESYTISFNKEEMTKEIGSIFRPSYTITPETTEALNLVWTSSDENVASVGVDGLVTPLNVGQTTIKVAFKDKPDICDTLKLTVTSSGGGSITPTSSSGCQGNIATTSVVISVFSLFGVGLLLISKGKKKKYEE